MLTCQVLACILFHFFPLMSVQKLIAGSVPLWLWDRLGFSPLHLPVPSFCYSPFFSLHHRCYATVGKEAQLDVCPALPTTENTGCLFCFSYSSHVYSLVFEVG